MRVLNFFIATDAHRQTQTILSADSADKMVQACGAMDIAYITQVSHPYFAISYALMARKI